MIQVLSITGESFDLTTGQEHGRGIVLTNGISTRHIATDDRAIAQIIELFAEMQRGQQPESHLEPDAPVPVARTVREPEVPAKSNRQYADDTGVESI